MTSRRTYSDDDDDETFTFAFSRPNFVEWNSGGRTPPFPPKPARPARPPRPVRPPYAFVGGFNFVDDQNRINNYSQRINDDVLELLVLMPGIDKKTLKVRSRSDKVSISAEIKDEYQAVLGTTPINYIYQLKEKVNPDLAKAKYIDGILQILIPLIETGTEFEVNYDEE